MPFASMYHFYMENITDIKSTHWQPALGATDDQVVVNFDDLNQAVRIILGTPKGMEPLRPDFGSNLYLYLDYPIDRAKPHIVRESILALRQWEPRIDVERIDYEILPASQGGAHAIVKVWWRLAKDLEGDFKNGMSEVYL